MEEQEDDMSPYAIENEFQEASVAWVDRLLNERWISRRSVGSVDAMLDFRRCMKNGTGAGMMVRAFYSLSPILSRECYLTQFRVRKEVQRRVRAVVRAPEWTDREMISLLRLERARSFAGLEAQLKRDFFEHAELIVPERAIVVKWVRAPDGG